MHVDRGVRHRWPTSAAQNFAVATSAAAGAPAESSHAACHVVSRTASTSTYASASRCVTAWNDPIGRPNCTRFRAYSAVSSSARSITPDCAAHNPTVARAISQSATPRPRHPKRVRAPGRRPP
jgi:hypothetical protein